MYSEINTVERSSMWDLLGRVPLEPEQRVVLHRITYSGENRMWERKHWISSSEGLARRARTQ